MPVVRLLIFAVLSALALTAANSAAEQYFKDGAKAEREGRTVEAYLLYAQAAAAEPRNQLYLLKAEALRPFALMRARQELPATITSTGTAAKVAPRTAADIEKKYASITGSISQEDLDNIARMRPPVRLQPSLATKSFHLRGDAKTLYDQVAAAYGYQIIFDRDYQIGQTFHYDVDNANYRDALHTMEQATNTFLVPLSPKLLMVAQDTAQKRQELEATETAAIPIPERTSVQEAQELSMVVQQVLEVRRIILDPQKRMVLLRDKVSKVELAKALLAQLSFPKPQVNVEVEFISVGKTSSLSLGMQLPNSFPIVNFGGTRHIGLTLQQAALPSGIANFMTFGGGATLMGIGITNAELFATASRTSASTLLKSQMLATDGQPASLHVGDKYPIITGGYASFGGLGSGSSGGGGTQTTLAMLSTTPYPDVTTANVSTTGTMNLVVNGQSYPFTLPVGYNNVEGLMNELATIGAPVGVNFISLGTNTKPYTLLFDATTLGVTSIQLYDDPSGQNVALLKTTDTKSSITTASYPDVSKTNVSTAGSLSLSVGDTATPFSLTTNTLAGMRDAINALNAGVTAAVLTTGEAPDPYYLQVVATTAGTGDVQIFDDPTGANTPLLSPTDQFNEVGNITGQQVTSGIPGSSNLSNLGQVYSPPPTMNFEDLGLVLKVTPTVHGADEVTLDVDAQFKVLGGGSVDGVPVISQRQLQGKVRLRMDEWAVVAGLVTHNRSVTKNGLWGFASIPLLGRLFRQDTTSKEDDQVLIVIKPEIRNLPPTEFVTREFRVGSDTRPITPL